MGPDRIYGKLREITIFRYRDSAPLPVRMRNWRYRVGRQGTLLCKEINIGYLKRLNYLPLRGEYLGLYPCVLTKLNAQYVKIYYIYQKFAYIVFVDLFIFFNLMYAIRNNLDEL